MPVKQHFLSTRSIESAYHQLTAVKVDNPSVLHIILILKACGFDKTSHKPVSLIANEGYKPAVMLSKLFSNLEQTPDKYDFISPFSMKDWKAQSVSESLNKWVKLRIINNVVGGGTTWRRVVNYNINDKTIKFKYEYVDEVKDLTILSSKINLLSLAIWSQRFNPFDRKMGSSELVDIFKGIFNITDDETHKIFTHNNKGVLVEYSDEQHDTAKIRSLIGAPPNTTAESWFESRPSTNTNYKLDLAKEIIMPNFKEMSKPNIVTHPLLEKYSQVILAGPPGTSKSYIANQLSSKYPKENVIKIQFHPSYSYQTFIGGYTVDGVNVIWQDGVLFSFAQKAKENRQQKFLIIIDEINRANVSQVFGETIQCLDRGNVTSVSRKGIPTDFILPQNLKIIGTMNTSDRTIGAIDFAIKRRFVTIYMPPDPALVDEHCDSDLDIALGDFLRRINGKLELTLKNKELVIGHALLMDETSYDTRSKKYFWTKNDFELLFNYKILPLIEDYTKGNSSQLYEVLGATLPERLTGIEFITAISLFVENAS